MISWASNRTQFMSFLSKMTHMTFRCVFLQLYLLGNTGTFKNCCSKTSNVAASVMKTCVWCDEEFLNLIHETNQKARIQLHHLLFLQMFYLFLNVKPTPTVLVFMHIFIHYYMNINYSYISGGFVQMFTRFRWKPAHC